MHWLKSIIQICIAIFFYKNIQYFKKAPLAIYDNLILSVIYSQ